jgi:hypothetical protein
MIGRHYHPHIHERFKVIRGQVSFTLDEVEQSAKPGQTVDILPGTLHSFWMRGVIELVPGGRVVGELHVVPRGYTQLPHLSKTNDRDQLQEFRDDAQNAETIRSRMYCSSVRLDRNFPQMPMYSRFCRSSV